MSAIPACLNAGFEKLSWTTWYFRNFKRSSHRAPVLCNSESNQRLFFPCESPEGPETSYDRVSSALNGRTRRQCWDIVDKWVSARHISRV